MGRMSLFLWRALELLLWGGAAGLAASRYALAPSVVAAVAGVWAGVWAGEHIARTRLRSTSLLLGTALLALAPLGAAWLLGRASFVASAFGPKTAYLLTELLPWCALPFLLAALMTALSRRYAVCRVLELALLSGLFAALFAAHREGFINRPFFLVDPIWGSGRDPLDFFLLLGAALAGILAIALAASYGGKRSLLGLWVLLVALGLLFFLLPQGQLKNIAELHRVMGEKGDEEGGQGGKKKEPSPEDPGGKGEQGGEGKKGESENDPNLPDNFESQSRSANTPLAVVVFHHDYTPPLGFYYFRETAFSAYNGVRLVRDATGKRDRDLLDLFPASATPLASAGLPHGTKRLSEVPGDSFQKVDTTVALLARHSRPFALVNPSEVRPATNPDSRRFFRAYGTSSWALTAPPQALVEEHAGGKGWSDPEWRHYTEGPEDARYAELVEQIVATLQPEYRDKPFARAVAIKLWLDKNSFYTLNSGHGESEDPVADFLFGDRRGHCVHLAHAASLLYRAAGVPSRVAVGYAVRADFRGGGASLLVRSREAHAWPEICLEGPGWLPLDITPEQSDAEPEEAPDPGLQQMLGEMAMKERPPPPDPEENRPDWGARLKVLARVLGWTLVALAALALLAGWGWKLWRRLSPRWGSDRKRPVTAYRAALDVLAEAGCVRGYGESREAFARRLPDLPAFAELTRLHLRHTLGAPLPETEGHKCLEGYRAMCAQVKSQPGKGRRLAGLFNPFSWVSVR